MNIFRVYTMAMKTPALLQDNGYGRNEGSWHKENVAGNKAVTARWLSRFKLSEK
jgi:hypothetical protein